MPNYKMSSILLPIHVTLNLKASMKPVLKQSHELSACSGPVQSKTYLMKLFLFTNDNMKTGHMVENMYPICHNNIR